MIPLFTASPPCPSSTAAITRRLGEAFVTAEVPQDALRATLTEAVA